MSIRAQKAVVLQLMVWSAGMTVAALPATSQEAQSIPSDRAAAIERALSEKTDVDATDLPSRHNLTAKRSPTPE